VLNLVIWSCQWRIVQPHFVYLSCNAGYISAKPFYMLSWPGCRRFAPSYLLVMDWLQDLLFIFRSHFWLFEIRDPLLFIMVNFYYVWYVSWNISGRDKFCFLNICPGSGSLADSLWWIYFKMSWTFLVGISFVFWMPRGRRSGSPDDSLRWILLYKMSCYCHGYLCSGSFPLLFFVGFRTVLVSFRVILLFFVGFRTDLVSLNVLRVLLIWFVAWSLPHSITRALALSRLQRNQFQTGSRP